MESTESPDGTTTTRDVGVKDDGGPNVASIAGGVGGGLAVLLLVAAAVAYKVKGGATVAQPPPSYDDIVGTA